MLGVASSAIVDFVVLYTSLCYCVVSHATQNLVACMLKLVLEVRVL